MWGVALADFDFFSTAKTASHLSSQHHSYHLEAKRPFPLPILTSTPV
jgi:hypothetical protein